MEAAQKRLEKELVEGEELAIEDGPRTGPPKTGRKFQGTPSTPAKASDDPTQVPSSSASRTPEILGPKKKGSLEEEEERGKTLPTSTSTSKKAGEEGGKFEEEIEVEVRLGNEAIEEHDISTPPDGVRKPLFDDVQLQDLNAIQQQAPWLYQKFETPETVPRPTFLSEEEGRTENQRYEEAARRQKIVKALEEKAAMEKAQAVEASEKVKEEEKEQLARQVRILVEENQKLKEDFEAVAAVASLKQVEEMERRPAKQVKKLLEENLQLRSHLHRLEDRGGGKPEDEAVFATPNGSAATEEAGTPEGARGGVEDEERKKKDEEGRGKGKGTRRPEETRGESLPPQTLDVILKLMEGMQEIQKKLVKGGSDDSEESEVVRHSVELPKLQEWSSESGPIDFADWLLLLQPPMSDLSATSEEWWSQMVSTAREWYSSHMLKTPLDRLTHVPVPGASLQQKRWSRLERRASALLLAAIPEGLREEVVSSKSISTLGILAKGMVQYQPGGLAERTAILTALECPTEAPTVSAAIVTLRKWQRWKRRAEELKVSIPDPTILAKGLTRLVRKVAQGFPELSFRLQLVRSSLMVDAVPSHDSISKYSEHLMAELEQVNQQSRKREYGATAEAPKIKKFEEVPKEKKEGEKERREGDSKERGKCRFYLTDQGCRRGKGCSYSHEVKDDRRRCWNCGAVDHMSPQCTRPKDSKDAVKPKVSRMEKEKEDGKKEDAEGSASPPTVKELLDEANKVLKSLGPSTSASQVKPTGGVKGDAERQEVVDRLQAQLNALRKFRLRKICRNEKAGLLDSGATHPLRPVKEGEDVNAYHKVQVSLADGQTIWLPMSPGGAMLSTEEDVEPILPMGMLTDVLGCEVSWTREGIEVRHPNHGMLPVKEVDGCPQLPRPLALRLIEELEEVKKGMKFKEVEDFEKEVDWMRRLVDAHPVLSTLPQEIQEKLVVTPGSWSSLPANKRKRKAMQRDGFICHLFAGEESGYTLERAWKQSGGGEKEMLEIDIKRGLDHDLLSSSGPYSGLLRAVWEDKLLALISGPNCRTRSVLRHYPVEGEAPPRPVRRWGGEEFGIEDATPEERQKIFEDDLLQWRMIFLAVVSKQGNDLLDGTVSITEGLHARSCLILGHQSMEEAQRREGLEGSDLSAEAFGRSYSKANDVWRESAAMPRRF